jgi:hypothetical protein
MRNRETEARRDTRGNSLRTGRAGLKIADAHKGRPRWGMRDEEETAVDRQRLQEDSSHDRRKGASAPIMPVAGAPCGSQPGAFLQQQPDGRVLQMKSRRNSIARQPMAGERLAPQLPPGWDTPKEEEATWKQSNDPSHPEFPQVI